MCNHIGIVANGSMTDYDHFRKLLMSIDTVIGVDGGMKHLKKMGISPKLMMGDFDSIESLDLYKKVFPEAAVESFEVRKDYTDSELAVRKAIEKGPKRVSLFAVTGNRLDHTLANMSLLKLLYDAGIEATIFDEDNEIRYTEKSLDLCGGVGSNMSLLPVSEEVTGIYLEGFEYPLENAVLKFGSTTGISNVFAVENARVEIGSGRVLVIQSRD